MKILSSTAIQEKLEHLNEEIQEFKIMQDTAADLYGLPDILREIMLVMNIQFSDNKEFENYIQLVPLNGLNKSMALSKENSKSEIEKDKKLLTIKAEVKKSILLFKEACEHFNVDLLSPKKETNNNFV